MKPGTFWLLLILVVYLGLATWQLRELPGEWFGDISILHEEVLDILKNPLDWKFNLSAGPVYHHLVAVLAAVYGARYETYKVASGLAGMAGLVFMYLLGKEIGGERVGLLTAGVGAVSFWYLMWARLGSSPQSLAPVIVGVSGWLTVRFLRSGKPRDLILAELVAVLSWWTYPALYTLPFLPLILGFWGKRGRRQGLVGAIVVLVVSLGLFWLSIQKQPDLFAKGYIGEKVFKAQEPAMAVIQVGKNLLKTAGMLHYRGDAGFRINVANRPMLDRLSQVLFLIGLGGLLASKRWRGKRAAILIPLFVLVLPSVSPAIPIAEIPSGARTFGVFPYVALLVALGMESLITIMEKRKIKVAWIAMGLGLGLITIASLNFKHYFVAYAWQLPNHNSAYGLYVAEWLDTLPEETVVKLAGCCWGEAGIAEPKGIFYSMAKQAGRENIVYDYPFVAECSDFQPGVDYAVVFDPRDTVLIEKLSACFDTKVQAGYEDKYGQLTFVGIRGRIDDR